MVLGHLWALRSVHGSRPLGMPALLQGGLANLLLEASLCPAQQPRENASNRAEESQALWPGGRCSGR